MRIWYQTMADISRYPEYGDALRRRAAAILRSDTEVDVHGVAAGTYAELPPSSVSIHPLAYHVLLDQVIGNAVIAPHRCGSSSPRCPRTTSSPALLRRAS